MDFSKYYAHGVAIATTIVGFVVAFVPSWGNHGSVEEATIAIGGIVIGFGILVWDAVKNRPAGVTGEAAVADVEKTFRSLLSRVDFSAIVQGELAKAGQSSKPTTTPGA